MKFVYIKEISLLLDNYQHTKLSLSDHYHHTKNFSSHLVSHYIMDVLNESSQPQHYSAQNPTLQVDFIWKKYKTLITELDKSEPVYIVDFNTFKSPSMVYKSAADDKTIGTGTLHPISIHADYEIYGQKRQLKALKRWKTAYTHLSHAFSDTDSPVTMTWTSECGFKTWDFICLDEQQMPVAKFSSNVWALKKLGNIEFLGSKATSKAARDEIVVVGMTLYFCMLLRTNNILSVVGSIFARTGPIKNDAATELQQVDGQHDKGVRSTSQQEVVGVNKQRGAENGVIGLPRSKFRRCYEF